MLVSVKQTPEEAVAITIIDVTPTILFHKMASERLCRIFIFRFHILQKLPFCIILNIVQKMKIVRIWMESLVCY